MGTLDKFIGDAIMAFYGAPLVLPDHPLRACRSALSMISTLEKLNAKWKLEGKGPIKIGIGLNTGEAKVGNFGSLERFNYTVIGEGVNLTSRLEGITKVYGVDIVMGFSTYNNVKDTMLCRPLDLIRVKGSKKPIKIFELVGTRKQSSKEMQEKVLEFQKGLDFYFSKQWKNAEDFFSQFLERFPDDKPAQVFLERVRTLIKDPPPEDWDCVFSFFTK